MAYRSAETIDDLLADSLIQKVMLADRVEPRRSEGPCLTGQPAASPMRGVLPPCRWGRISAGAAFFARPLLLMRPTPRATGGECGASLCG